MAPFQLSQKTGENVSEKEISDLKIAAVAKFIARMHSSNLA